MIQYSLLQHHLAIAQRERLLHLQDQETLGHMPLWSVQQ
jgi:hypothetical protein